MNKIIMFIGFCIFVTTTLGEESLKTPQDTYQDADQLKETEWTTDYDRDSFGFPKEVMDLESGGDVNNNGQHTISKRNPEAELLTKLRKLRKQYRAKLLNQQIRKYLIEKYKV